MTTQFPLLFSPISINTLNLKNRIVMPPMCTAFATIGGAVTDRLIEYYRERARGGVGLINVEFSYVLPNGKVFTHMLGIHEDRLVPGLKRLVDSVHQEGAKIIIQISHAGRRTHSEVIGSLPVGPSPVPRLNGETPAELSVSEIEGLVRAFIEAARRAKEAGFDGVMIHMAHAYLIQQFLSPLSNRRRDLYGGDLEGRSRFAVEILRGIRKAVGEDYPLTCRLCGNEFVKNGIDLNEAAQIAAILEKNGINAIEVSAGAHETPEYMIAPPYFPMGFLAPLSEGIKSRVQIPVGIIGRIHDPWLAEDLLRGKKADLIAVGRALIADPKWPQKVYEGRTDDICPCISCNQGCADRMYRQQDISCTVNPSVGREKIFPITAAKWAKRVLILGGGPAGLEAARIAAMRGHKVQLYEKEKELGGQLKIASVPPGKEDLERFRKFLIRQIQANGVEVKHGTINKRALEKFSPEFVVMATGGKPAKMPGAASKSGKIVSTWDVLSGRKIAGQRVVVIGGGQVGLETADFLLTEGKEIIILEMLKDAGQDMSPRARKVILEKLLQRGVEVITDAVALSSDGNRVVYDRGGVWNQVEGVDWVVIAVGTEPQKASIDGLASLKVPVKKIGDCSAPRKAFEAVQEGFMVGIEI